MFSTFSCIIVADRPSCQLFPSGHPWPRNQCTLTSFRYLNTYKKYQDLFNNKAEIDVATFLEEQIALLSFSKRINFYQNLASEISSLYLTVPLNMFCLNCHEVNVELAQRARKLADKLILHIVDGNRETNRGYVMKYKDKKLCDIISWFSLQ